MNNQPPLGVTEAQIASAEAEMQVRFPDVLREVWMTYNCNELKGGWRVFPIFDPQNPRKSCSSVVYENNKGRWSVMPYDLVSIADNGTGNQLVLRVTSTVAGPDVFHWHHETGKLVRWEPGLESILRTAKQARESVIRLSSKYPRAG